MPHGRRPRNRAIRSSPGFYARKLHHRLFQIRLHRFHAQHHPVPWRQGFVRALLPENGLARVREQGQGQHPPHRRFAYPGRRRLGPYPRAPDQGISGFFRRTRLRVPVFRRTHQHAFQLRLQVQGRVGHEQERSPRSQEAAWPAGHRREHERPARRIFSPARQVQSGPDLRGNPLPPLRVQRQQQRRPRTRSRFGGYQGRLRFPHAELRIQEPPPDRHAHLRLPLGRHDTAGQSNAVPGRFARAGFHLPGQSRHAERRFYRRQHRKEERSPACTGSLCRLDVPGRLRHYGHDLPREGRTEG